MDIRIKDIIVQTCMDHSVEYNDVMGQNRTIEVVVARNDAMHKMNVELKMSTTAIGRIFGKTHATVIHSLKEAEKFRAAAVNTNEFVEGLLAERTRLQRRVNVITQLINTY